MTHEDQLDDPSGDVALRAVVRHTQHVPLSLERTHGIARMLAAARGAIDAVTPPTLFDTEPDNLRVLLEESK